MLKIPREFEHNSSGMEENVMHKCSNNLWSIPKTVFTLAKEYEQKYSGMEDNMIHKHNN